MKSVNPVDPKDIRRLMWARLSGAAGQLDVIHTTFLRAVGVSEAVQLRLDFLHVVVYDDRMMDPNGPYFSLVKYDPYGEVLWFDPLLIDAASHFHFQDNLGVSLNSYFDCLDGML